MTLATTSKLFRIAEYLKQDDGTDTRYELVNRELVYEELVKMPAKSFGNITITKYLMFEFAKYVPLLYIAFNTEVQVIGKRVTCRVPDLVILT